MTTDQENGAGGGGRCGGGVVMQERREELLEKYPCGIERGWDLVQKWGLALAEVTQSHRNKAWYHSTSFTISPRKQKHPERSCSPVPPLVVEDWGEEKGWKSCWEWERERTRTPNDSWQHYWSMGADNDQGFRMRSASKVVCFSQALLVARMLAWNRRKSWFNQAWKFTSTMQWERSKEDEGACKRRKMLDHRT